MIFLQTFFKDGESIGTDISCAGFFTGHHYFRDQIGQCRAASIRVAQFFGALRQDVHKILHFAQFPGRDVGGQVRAGGNGAAA